MTYHTGIFCPKCDERYEVRTAHDNGYIYFVCRQSHEWYCIGAVGSAKNVAAAAQEVVRQARLLPPPSVQHAINQYVEPTKPSVIVIDEAMEIPKGDLQRLRAATDGPVTIEARTYHSRTRMIFVCSPRGRADMSTFESLVDRLDDSLNKFRRHLSDIPMDTDFIPSR